MRAWIEPAGDEVPTAFDKIEVFEVLPDGLLGKYGYVTVDSPFKYTIEQTDEDRLIQKMHESAWESGLEEPETVLEEKTKTVEVDLSGEDKDLLLALYFNSRRILDALYVIAGPESAKKLRDIHEAGEFLSIDPFVDQEEK